MLGEGGFVKVVAEAGDGPVRGVHMIGPHVTDLIAEGMLITNWEATPVEVAAMIHPHPSLSEGIGEAHLALAGKPLHTAVRSEPSGDRSRADRHRRGGPSLCPTTSWSRCCTCSS